MEEFVSSEFWIYANFHLNRIFVAISGSGREIFKSKIIANAKIFEYYMVSSISSSIIRWI